MRICTWNSLGDKFNGGYIKQLLLNLNIDVLCLQECGNLARYFDHDTDLTNLQTTTYKVNSNISYHLIYHIWNTGGRCDMAMLIRDNIQIGNKFIKKTSILYDSNGEELFEMPCNTEKSIVREMISVEMIYNHNFYTINNVHLPSGNSSFARKIGYRLFCNYTMRINPNIYTLGDFNTQPNKWTLAPGLYMHAPTVQTHRGGHILDYMITNKATSYTANVHYDSYGSDHSPVYYDI